MSIGPTDELLIIGCDGLWDVLSDEEAWSVARRCGKKGGAWDLQAAAEGLTAAALERGSSDNVSVVCVKLK